MKPDPFSRETSTKCTWLCVHECFRIIFRFTFHFVIVSEVSVTLEKIKNHIDDCVPLMNKLNNCLPEELRLEYLSLRQGRSPVSELIPTEHIGVTQARDDEMESDSQ